MKLGLSLNYAGRKLSLPLELAAEAEALGFDAVWCSEAYGSDAVSVAAWVLARTQRIRVGTAILQLAARTPTMAAMTAMSLDHLSGGRFILGLGPSGPQVVEGWYGASYRKPLTRQREYIEIIKRVFARDEPVMYDGTYYQLPYRGSDGTGLGKPLKCTLHCRGHIPIYTASLQPKAIALSAELTDGFIPSWLDPERADIFEPSVREGLARSGKQRADFTMAPFVNVAMGPDLERCRAQLRPWLALYIGGMGARGKNFYNEYACRLGYESEAARIQDLYLDGHKDRACAAVPDSLIDRISLVGDEARIKDRLQAWKAAGAAHCVDALIVSSRQPEALRVVAEALL